MGDERELGGEGDVTHNRLEARVLWLRAKPQATDRNPKGAIWIHPVIANGKIHLRRAIASKSVLLLRLSLVKPDHGPEAQ